MTHLSHLRLLPVLALLTVSALAGCSKGAVSPGDAEEKLLVGRWELTQTDGGLSGRVQPADPVRKQEIIFGPDHQVAFLLNGVPTGTSTYSLFQANSYVNRRPQTFLSYGPKSGTEKEFIERVSSSQLVIVEDYADGLGYYYTHQ